MSDDTWEANPIKPALVTVNRATGKVVITPEATRDQLAEIAKSLADMVTARDRRIASLEGALRKVSAHCEEMQDRESGPGAFSAALRCINDAMYILRIADAALRGGDGET